MTKVEFRKICIKRLARKKPILAHLKVYKRLCFILEKHKCKKILIYLPLKNEVDLLRFRRKLSHKYEIFSTFMQGESLNVVKLRLPFHKKRFGLNECMNSNAASRLDAAIVPVIGMDKNYKRIGHGMGFYDRFFANLGYLPLIIFVSVENNYIKKSLCEPHDVRARYYLTPFTWYMKREKNDFNLFANFLHSRTFARLRSG